MNIASIGSSQLSAASQWDSSHALNNTLAQAPSNESMNTQTTKTEPDPDAIKMFVGQIPRSMDENDLRKLFEEFGPVFQLNVLRDKLTGQSKGCCFVTFYTRKAALDAQNAMHNMKTMPGMQHPIQMKPADSEKRTEDRKLFVGMLSKKGTEKDVRMMFAPFGTIEECTVLREQNGQSKGCAFVTYASKQCAQNAIKSMHHSQTMENCRAPLVVKFADSQRDKEMKKLQQLNSNLMSMNLSSLGLAAPQYLALLQQAASGGLSSGMGNMGGANNGVNLMQVQQLLAAANAAANVLQNNPGDSSNLQALQNLQSLAALASVSNNATGGLNSIQGISALNQLASLANSTGVNPLQALGASDSVTFSAGNCGTSNSSTSAVSMSGLSAMQNNLPNVGAIAPSVGNGSMGNGIGNASMAGASGQAGVDATLSQAYSGIQQYAASFPNAFSATTAAQLQQAAANSPAGKQTEGPDGANLFIYHLPQEFGDQDLMQMFLPFGTVISAKVFIDKQTNLSKCFGFVSYDNSVSAQAAIQAMNGFQIGMKRLKVQLKRPKSESKPY